MNEPFFTEEQKAAIAERQTVVAPSNKVLAEFALQDYPDKFAQIYKACKDMGIGPADFASGYIAACAMNLYICFPEKGKERIVAAIFGKMLEEELLRNWEIKL